MMDALTMGNYGVYVWSCFGLSLIVVIVCAVQAWQRHRNIFNDIRMRLRAMDSEL